MSISSQPTLRSAGSMRRRAILEYPRRRTFSGFLGAVIFGGILREVSRKFHGLPPAAVYLGGRPMVFTKRLRERVRSGEITCSVRMWTQPHVKVGGRYPMEDGEIVVESITSIELADVTPELARRSGFK